MAGVRGVIGDDFGSSEDETGRCSSLEVLASSGGSGILRSWTVSMEARSRVGEGVLRSADLGWTFGVSESDEFSWLKYCAPRLLLLLGRCLSDGIASVSGVFPRAMLDRFEGGG